MRSRPLSSPADADGAPCVSAAAQPEDENWMAFPDTDRLGPVALHVHVRTILSLIVLNGKGGGLWLTHPKNK